MGEGIEVVDEGAQGHDWEVLGEVLEGFGAAAVVSQQEVVAGRGAVDTVELPDEEVIRPIVGLDVDARKIGELMNKNPYPVVHIDVLALVFELGLDVEVKDHTRRDQDLLDAILVAQAFVELVEKPSEPLDEREISDLFEKD